MSPETVGYRFYRLRRNPWRPADRIENLAGTMYKPADYDGDYLMACPAEQNRNGRRYNLVYGALVPGNRESLGHEDVARLTDLAHAGCRRIAFDQLPPAWQRVFGAETAAIAVEEAS